MCKAGLYEEGRISDPKFKLREGASEVQPSSNIPALFFGVFFFFLEGYGLKKLPE